MSKSKQERAPVAELFPPQGRSQGDPLLRRGAPHDPERPDDGQWPRLGDDRGDGGALRMKLRLPGGGWVRAV